MTILLFSVVLFYSRLRWIQFWIWIELNQLFFLFFIRLFFLTKIETIIKYFIIQRITSIILIIALILFKNDFFILIVLFLKLGLIPLHSWILNMIKSMELFSYFVLLTIQKIQLLLVFLLVIKTYSSQFSIILIILFSYTIIIKETFGKKFFFFSSMNFFFLFVLLSYFSLSLRFSFWLCYSFFFFFLLSSFLISNFTFFLFKNKILISLLLLVIIGFPPFPIFFFKINIINFFFKDILWTISLFLIGVVFFSLYIYIRVIFSSFLLVFKKTSLNKKMGYFKAGLITRILFL